MTDRKFGTWDWKGEAGQAVSMEVRVKWGDETWKDLIKTANSGLDAERMPIFYVKLVKPDMTIESGSLQELAAKVVETLDGFFKIEWSPKLVVEMNTGSEKFVVPEANKKPLRADFTIRVIKVAVGATQEGVSYYRFGKKDERRDYTYRQGTIEEACKPSPERWGKTLWSADHTILGVVDDTPENQAAIQDLCDRVDELRLRLINFMQGDDALQNALTLGAKRLLTTGNDQPSDT